MHLTDWPSADDLPADAALVTAMDQVREVCSAGSALRKGAGLRNRLPLAEMTIVVTGADTLAGFEPIVADELNVKSVRLLDADHPEAASYGVSRRLTVNARAAGPRLGKDVQTAIRAAKSGDWSVAADGSVTAGGLALQEGEYTLDTVAGGGDGAATGMLPRGGFVVLDLALTPELEAEGVARDLVRAVQQARRDAGLDVSDRIALTIAATSEVAAAARAHRDLIAAETLATSLDVEVSDVEHPVIELPTESRLDRHDPWALIEEVAQRPSRDPVSGPSPLRRRGRRHLEPECREPLGCGRVAAAEPVSHRAALVRVAVRPGVAPGSGRGAPRPPARRRRRRRRAPAGP